MAISINWGTKVINVPRADMLLVQASPEIRQLNLDNFRKTLNDLQDDEAGMSFETTHRHVQPITVGGVTLERVVEIINGYTVTFEDGQYAVNLVGANSNVGDVVNVNQVSVRSANSAGLVNLDTILAASYQGKVVVNTVTGQAGTAVPLGTSSNPVNNFEDAKTIADNFGITVIEMQRSATLSDGDFSSGFTFQGTSAQVVTFTVDSYAIVDNCTFRNLTLQGEIDSLAMVEGCEVETLTVKNGVFFQCHLNATLNLMGNGQIDLIYCWSDVAGGGPGQTPTLSFGGLQTDVIVRGYNGGLRIEGFDQTTGEDVSIDMASGRVVVADTCISGTITIRGVAEIEDLTTDSNMFVNDKTVRGLRQVDNALMERRIVQAL